MDFVAEEDIVLAFSSPPGITVRVISRTMVLPLTGAGLLSKLTRVGPEMSRIYSCIATDNYLQDNSLGNQPVENFIENVLAEAVTEVGKGAIGWGLEEIEATEEAEPGVIAQS